MQKEDGPYRNTRSSAGSNSDKTATGNYMEEDSSKDEVFHIFQEHTSNQRKLNTEIERPRTPSGHLMSSSVGKIRTIFSQPNRSKSSDITPKAGRKDSLQSNSTEKAKCNSKKTKTKGPIQSSNQPTLPFKVVQPNTTHQKSSKDNTEEPNCEESENQNKPDNGARRKVPPKQTQSYTVNTKIAVNCNPYDLSDFSIVSEESNTSVKTSYKAMSRQECENHNKTDGNSIDTETNINGTDTAKEIPEPVSQQLQSQQQSLEIPKVMDLQIVLQMFREIKEDLNQWKQNVDIEKVKTIVDNNDSQISAIEMLQREMRQQKEQNRIMVGTIQRMATVMNEMTHRITELEKHRDKTSIVMTGFPFIPNKKERMYQLVEFFFEAMNIETKIEDTYYIGEGETKSIVITFYSVQERNKILFNRTKLKDFTNNNDKPFYINELLPPELNETRRREREIYGQNKTNTANKVEMSFFRGGLKIQNEVYKGKVRVPEPQEFLSLSDRDLSNIMKVKIVPGKQIQEQSSTFTGYITKAVNHDQVRKAYMRMKLALPQARHIMCSYRITGVEKYHSEAYCDDGEYAGGRAIMEMMKKHKIFNCAVFIVRFYGGSKLGAKRFDLIKQAAEYAIEKAEEVGAQREENEPTKERRDESPSENPTDKQKYTFKQKQKRNDYGSMPELYSDAVKANEHGNESLISRTARKLVYSNDS